MTATRVPTYYSQCVTDELHEYEEAKGGDGVELAIEAADVLIRAVQLIRSLEDVDGWDLELLARVGLVKHVLRSSYGKDKDLEYTVLSKILIEELVA